MDADGARIFGRTNGLSRPLEINIHHAGQLSGVMLVVVRVSLLVQIYSQEYMRGDPGYNRYYAFMSLFTTSMLGLILASSVLQIFVSGSWWALLYLLIGLVL
jgi:NADH:ubiquinone oxidoreductase subunit 5 (subunit L)/multisubunit Na+/H+ antiporter MnhA subunit